MGIATMGKQGMINHIAIVMDKSGSMWTHQSAVVSVVDGLVANLAAQAGGRPDQETRVTVYTFNEKTDCVYYDKDVLRLPSLKGHYRTGGMTGMISAVEKALDDLRRNPELYGDHANLLYLMTDGFESERRTDAEVLARKIRGLPDNYTVAALVPGDRERNQVASFGIARDNIAEWDASSAQGVAQAGARISQATSTYMDNRAQGLRSTTSLFSTGAEVLNTANLQAVGAKLLTSGFQLVKAIGTPEKMKTEDFAHSLGLKYVNGSIYYQLIKREKIQGHKGLLAQNRKTKEIFWGDGIRALVGLGSGEQSVAPDFNKDFALFVQSTAPNRHVVVNQEFVIMNPIALRQ